MQCNPRYQTSQLSSNCVHLNPNGFQLQTLDFYNLIPKSTSHIVSWHPTLLVSTKSVSVLHWSIHGIQDSNEMLQCISGYSVSTRSSCYYTTAWNITFQHMVERSFVSYYLSSGYNIISPNQKHPANLNYICATKPSNCAHLRAKQASTAWQCPLHLNNATHQNDMLERYVNGGLLRFSQIPRSSERHCPGKIAQ